MAGRLVVFEGSEGAGKTTQIALLAQALDRANTKHLVVREPGGTPVGDEIRRVLLDPVSDIAPRAEALLFMASRAQLVERVVWPALESGHVVLVDRFFLSTYAYQGAGRGLSEDDLRAANAVATGGLVPDLTLLLVLPAAEGLRRAAQRGGHDRMERAHLDFHERVGRAFGRFAEPAWQASHPECGPIQIVDAQGSAEDVSSRIRSALHSRWPGTFA